MCLTFAELEEGREREGNTNTLISINRPFAGESNNEASWTGAEIFPKNVKPRGKEKRKADEILGKMGTSD